MTIKGMDDGVKTSRQQDYNEALLNAKLQAIERAGVEIKSITQMMNFQLMFDAVESRAQAVLLPGFQVVDIGYTADGTYQVVLIGKIQRGEQNLGYGYLMVCGSHKMRLDGMGEAEFSSIPLGQSCRLFKLPAKTYEGTFGYDDHPLRPEVPRKIVVRAGEARGVEWVGGPFGEGLKLVYEKNYGGVKFSSTSADGWVLIGNCSLPFSFHRDGFDRSVVYSGLIFVPPGGYSVTVVYADARNNWKEQGREFMKVSVGARQAIEMYKGVESNGLTPANWSIYRPSDELAYRGDRIGHCVVR